MRQLIIAAVTLVLLAAACSTLALRSQSEQVTHCGAVASSPACFRGRVPLEL
jgi:hypothetical protein